MALRRLWRRRPSAAPVRLLQILVLTWIALALYGYRQVLVDLVGQWQTDTSYSHGFAVVPIALWLLWQRRSTLPPLDQPWVGAFGLLLTAHVLFFAGSYLHVPALQRWTIPLVVAGMIGLLAGRKVLIWSLPGVAFLGFMIPVPFRLEMLASEFMQTASAWCSCYLLGVTSTFAVTDGYTLRMASGELGITDDCSGLRMTVAVAALAYIITFLNGRPSDVERLRRPSYQSVLARLCLMMLMVTPTAILANAARIAVVAWVMERYQTSEYTTKAHDVADWLVLPISALLFMSFRAWSRSVARTWNNTARAERMASDNSDAVFSSWQSFTPALRIAVAPAAFAAIVGASILHYRSIRAHTISRLTTTAANYEAKQQWADAASCYRTLINLQPSDMDACHRHAWVLLQRAETRDDRMQVFFQLESILKRAPFHLGTLRTHLQMSLEHGDAESAVRSADPLYTIDRRDSRSLRLCLESMLRFPQYSARSNAITVERFAETVDRFGPVSHWRDELVIAVASFCCDHPESISPSVTSKIQPVLVAAADRVGSTKALLEAWRFDHVFGTGESSIERARLSMDAGCSADVAYRVYLASARESLRDRSPDDARQFLESAVAVLPNEHTAFAELGNLFRTQQQWRRSTAAYLRAWRLAGDRPVELGVELAEALIRTQHHSEAVSLVSQLMDRDSTASTSADRIYRIRLMIVQAQLDMQTAKHDQALATLRHCRSLVEMHNRASGSPNPLLSAVESLQAKCYVQMGRYADAARLFEHRANGREQSADQWVAAARAWRSDGNMPAAERCYQSAIAQLGYDSNIWLESIVLLKSRYGKEAAAEEIALRQQLYRETPSISHRILAQAWELVGHADDAIEQYRIAADRDVRDVASLAIALARNGKEDEAVECVSDPRWSVSPSLRAHTAAVVAANATDLSSTSRSTLEELMQSGLAESTDDTAVLLAVVQWYSHSGNIAAAKELLQRTVALNRESSVIAGNNLAMLLADEGKDFDHALTCIDRVLEQTGPVSEFLDTKGWILVQMDRSDDAIPLLVSALEHADAATPGLHLHLAAAYRAVGQLKLAKQHFESAEAAQPPLNQLNRSEQHAWTALQKEFSHVDELTDQQFLKQGGNA